MAPGELFSYVDKLLSYQLYCRFTINITTGELYVNRLLDYEEVQKWYIVVVMVIDYPGGEMGDRLSNVSVINITLVDVNDNRPVFSQSEYRVTVDENEEVFNYTGVRATDRDTGQLIVYSLPS